MIDRPTIQQLTDTLAAQAPPVLALHQAWNEYVDAVVVQDNAIITQLRDRIVELEAQLETPGDYGTLFGTSRPHAIGGGYEVPVVRAYVSDGKRPTSYSAMTTEAQRAMELATHAIILSWKEAPGAWLGDLLDDLRNVFPELALIGCQNHEPFDNFTTVASRSEYHRRWDVAAPMMLEAGWSSSTILDGSHPESWDWFARPDVELNGMDRYNPGIQTPKAYVDPATVYGPYVDWLDGQPGLIAETGTGLVDGDDGSGRVAWTKAAHDWLDGRVKFAAWWSQGGCQLDPQLLDVFLTGRLI